MLPARALQALVDIKKELLSRDREALPIAEPQEKPRPRTFEGHHARGSNAFQRGCRRRASWTPVH